MLNRFDTPLDVCNLKFVESGVDQVSNGLFEGYASTFSNIDSFGDTIMKGAFEETIKDREYPVMMLYQHSEPIGKWLEMEEDDTGLYVRGELTPNHQRASDVYASMKHGAISGLSIGFRIPAGGAEAIEGGGRRINNVKLEEVSVVGFPADQTARVSTVKAMAEEISTIESLRESETFLRDAGFSRSMAKAFISQCRPLFQREAEAARQQKEAREAALKWLNSIT